MSCVIQIGPQPIRVRTSLVGLRTPERSTWKPKAPGTAKPAFPFSFFCGVGHHFLRFASESTQGHLPCTLLEALSKGRLSVKH